MIGILEFLGWIAAGAALAVLASMVFALVVMLLGAALMDARSFLRERRAAMHAKKVDLRREAAHHRSLQEQLGTLRAENATLQYENQTLQRQLVHAGLLSPPKAPVEQPRTLHGIVEDRRP